MFLLAAFAVLDVGAKKGCSQAQQRPGVYNIFRSQYGPALHKSHAIFTLGVYLELFGLLPH